MKQERENYSKAYANAMLMLDYKKAKFTNITADWITVEAYFDECRIRFSIMESKMLFFIYDEAALNAEKYIKEEEKKALYEKIKAEYKKQKLDVINSKIESLQQEKQQILKQ